MKRNFKMLKSPVLALCVLCLGLAGASADNASKLQSERGTIKSVDQAHHSLVLSDHKAKTEHTFQWNDQTRFAEGGRAVSATDLKAGQHAVIRYQAGKGVATIRSLDLAAANAGKQHASRHPSSNQTSR